MATIGTFKKTGTEYTGETNYAERLAAAAKERGAPFEAAWLLAECAPKKTAA